MNFKSLSGRNIIPLFGTRSKTLFSQINEVEAYWYGLRSGRVVPFRSEIDPRGIERALPYTFILERIAPGLARFRLAGSHLNDLLGMEVRGMPFTSFFTPDARKVIMDQLECVFDGPEVAKLSIYTGKEIGRPPISGKVLLLPLKNDQGEISRIMGCFITEGQIGRVPRRFEVESIETTKLQVSPEMSGEKKNAAEIKDRLEHLSIQRGLRANPEKTTNQTKLRLVIVND